MLPESRQEDFLFKVPAFDINKDDIEKFSDELKGFHANFSNCFNAVISLLNFWRVATLNISDLEGYKPSSESNFSIASKHSS